ncbi:sterol desaturase family protein [Couchioplanes caeruleus]|uniref:sterol desaturase family protein n=1 Tax=Couchioplanes caeruleus TaxID=56438 RepID=UPI0020BE4468|nr:sterol desaturase family protein [Couchioplanes caeruleus]UQU63858.1 sterol desaturase family protein [Couchioplanes caeruleus]
MMDQVLDRLHDPAVYALPAIALLIVVEMIATYVDDDTKGYDRRDLRANVLTGIGALVVSTLMRTAALAIYAVAYVYIAPWHLDPGAWYTWVLLFFAVDILLYWYHRMAHRVRLMWAGHQVHHSSEYLNISVALRRKWAQWFEKIIWLPLPLLGVPPWMVFTMHSLHLLYGLFVHTEKIDKLPRPIEYFFVTPSHHRVHHGSDPEYLDKNYASTMIIWDRMFGTFQPEIRRPTYGLTTQINTHSIWRIQVHEFAAMIRDVRRARTFRHRLGYIFGPPGWQPTDLDGAPAEGSLPTPAPVVAS